MTNQWYFRVGEEELGPVTFRELAELIRFGVIGERDFVRSFWKETPQRVDSVVGLLYQSRQPPPMLPEQTAATPTIVEHLASIEVEERTDAAERPEWLQRLLELQSSLNTTSVAFNTQSGNDIPQSDRIAADTLVKEPNECAAVVSDIEAGYVTSTGMSSDFGELPSIGERSSAWESTMGAALSHVGVDVAPPPKRGVVRRTFGTIFSMTWRVLTSRQFLSRVFRTGCMIGVSVLVFNFVQEWSAGEEKRFPMRSSMGRSMRPGTPQIELPRHFPYLGRCTSTEYALLMLNSILVSSLAAYGVAAILESRAD